MNYFKCRKKKKSWLGFVEMDRKKRKLKLLFCFWNEKNGFFLGKCWNVGCVSKVFLFSVMTTTTTTIQEREKKRVYTSQYIDGTFIHWNKKTSSLYRKSLQEINLLENIWFCWSKDGSILSILLDELIFFWINLTSLNYESHS